MEQHGLFSACMEKMGQKCLMTVFEWAKNGVLISKWRASFAMPMKKAAAITVNRGSGNGWRILIEETGWFFSNRRENMLLRGNHG